MLYPSFTLRSPIQRFATRPGHRRSIIPRILFKRATRRSPGESATRSRPLRHLTAGLFALLLVALLGPLTPAGAVERDIVLMIDNSGSMRQNDPQFLTREAAAEFIDALDEDTYLAVLLFDHRIRMAFPLTSVTMQARARILEGLDQINFKGQRTNIPAAMERGIYELKHQGRQGAQKSIVFITDGIVDTGDRQNDLQKTSWLRESLAEDAAQNGIRIFGVAFTEQADFELIQSLAQKTGSAYFRAFSPEDISQVFGKINALITAAEPQPAPVQPPARIEPAQPAQTPQKAPPAATPEKPAPAPPAPAVTAAQPSPDTSVPPPPEPAAERQSGSDSRWLVAVLVVLVLFVAAAVVFLMWPRKKATLIRSVAGSDAAPSAGDIPVAMPGAYLKDLSGVTGKATIDLDMRMMKVGRLAGTESNPINDIVINKGTISRLHAIVEFKRHGFWVVDQGSANGSFLNGQRIVQEARLKHGDTVSFDTFDFEFIVKEMSQTDLGDADRTVFRREDETLLESPQVQMASLRSAFGESEASEDSQDSIPSSGGAYRAPEELQRSQSADEAGGEASGSPKVSPLAATHDLMPTPDPPSDLSAAPPEFRPEDLDPQGRRRPAVSPEAPTGEYEPLPPDVDEVATDKIDEQQPDQTACKSDSKP
jgi:pSer/pThr/pTyr-binding forkhead associated (FHA) protein